MKGKKELWIGLGILIVLIAAIVGIKMYNDNKTTDGGLTPAQTKKMANAKQVYVATGGGKENFIADEEVTKIMLDKYNLNVTYDTWSNGKTVLWPLVRESVGKGNSSIANELSKKHFAYTVTSPNVSKYDALFTSDQRFYDYFKVSPAKDEAARERVLNGGLTLNTPIVIYSWDTVVDALIKEKIVTEKNGTYYITDMNKLISYILQGKNGKT